MELEHAFQLSSFFTAFQLLFMSSLVVSGFLGRADIFRAFVRTVTMYLMSFGPVALLVYVLYEVSKLQ
jgi:hypothetical protein